MRSGACLIGVWTIALALVPGLAEAQRVLVLPARTVEGAAPDPAGLRVAAGPEALDPDASRLRFEEEASSEPPELSGSDIERWLASSRAAVRSLARADYAVARTDLLAAQEVSERAVAELNRELVRSRQVLDTCLYLVRAMVETDDLASAERQALDCRRLVPRVAPSEYNHPPEVLSLLRQIDVRSAMSPPASVRVESTPSGCAVRLNGIELGNTPLVSDDLLPGAYRVQVECDSARRGRVHRVRLGAGANVVRLDARFDAAVRTDGSLRLEYHDAESARARVGHAADVGALVGASEVWLVTPREDGRLRVERVLVSERRIVGSIVAASSELQAAAGPLRDGATARGTEGAGDRADDASVGDDTASLVVGVSLLALGAAGELAAGSMVAVRAGAGDRLAVAMPVDVDYLARAATWLDLRYGVWMPALGGATLGALAMPFLLPRARGVPWWSVAAGGFGVAALAGGVALAASAPQCGPAVEQEPPCIAAATQADAGFVLATLAGPWMTVPLVHLVRSVSGSAVSISAVSIGANVQAAHGDVTVHVGGGF